VPCAIRLLNDRNNETKTQETTCPARTLLTGKLMSLAYQMPNDLPMVRMGAMLPYINALPGSQ
jgi:hypothetical protein